MKSGKVGFFVNSLCGSKLCMNFDTVTVKDTSCTIRLALDDTICLTDSLQFYPGHCFSFKTIRDTSEQL